VFISKVAVRNFRAFDESGIEVLFNKGVNAIIGENNSGKSALIDAIRIAFSTVLYGHKDIYFKMSDFHVTAKGERVKSAQIDIYLDGVPSNLIEIWNPEDPTTGEFHLRFYSTTTPAGVEKVKHRAWGGKVEGNTLSSDTFDSINLAFLGALRDAENEMRPSKNSKLASLLSNIARDKAEKDKLVTVLQEANNALLEMEPIQKTKELINKNLLDIEQELLRQQVGVGLVEPRFEAIMSSLRSWIVPRWYYLAKDHELFSEITKACTNTNDQKLIHLVTDGVYVDIEGYLSSVPNISDKSKEALFSTMRHSFELHQNGLGYNNLLFMSAVLGDMSLDKNGIYLNLFAVEEPEAHLHPQLQELIHNFFERRHCESDSIQVIYTSHSPTLISRIGIESINLLYEDNHAIRSYPLSKAGLNANEKAHLKKYLDVTKSQMFFAKGVILVEGICEALLLPELAKLLNRPFDKYAVEVINVDGTSFKPFAKLLTLPDGHSSFVKASLVTDDDRCTDKDDKETYIPKELTVVDIADISEKIKKGSPSSRYTEIASLFDKASIEICGAKKTLEYELALPKNNASYMIDAISSIMPKIGASLKEAVEKEDNAEVKATLIWLCIRERDKYKGEIAQALSLLLMKDLEKKALGEQVESPFVVPKYLEKAIAAATEGFKNA